MNDSILEIDGHVGTLEELYQVPGLGAELMSTYAPGPDGIYYIYNLLSALGRGRIVELVPDEPEDTDAIY